jgi:hypothetical protein
LNYEGHLQSFPHHVGVLFRQVELLAGSRRPLAFPLQLLGTALLHRQHLELQLCGGLPHLLLLSPCGLADVSVFYRIISKQLKTILPFPYFNAKFRGLSLHPCPILIHCVCIALPPFSLPLLPPEASILVLTLPLILGTPISVFSQNY